MSNILRYVALSTLAWKSGLNGPGRSFYKPDPTPGELFYKAMRKKKAKIAEKSRRKNRKK